MTHLPYVRTALVLFSMAFAGCTVITASVTEDVIDCADRDDGTVCGNAIQDGVARICVGGACVTKACGDGYADEANGEECDDANSITGDGCDPASCMFECQADADCDDGRVCTGTETCDLTTHACGAGTSVVCTASDACHVNTCQEPDGMCSETLIADVDGDGHVSSTNYPTCGDDCNDGDSNVYPGHTEVCGDGKDNNCMNGTTDEAVLTWYADCDNDDYALMGAQTRVQCTMPATDAATTGCSNANGGWTNRTPNAQNTRDCSDATDEAHPDDPAVTFDNVTFHEGTVPVTGGYDWDCDGVWEQGLTNYHVSSSCLPYCSGLCLNWCTDGWSNTVAAPGCGATNQPFYNGTCSSPFTCSSCSSCALEYRNQTCK